MVHITPGVYPIPSKNRATAIEKIIFQLTANLSFLGCEAHIIDISTSESREATKAKIHETFNPVWLTPGKHFTLKSIVFALTSVFALLKLLRQNQIDIVHTHYSYSGLSCMLLCKLWRRTCHAHTTHAHDLVMYSSPLGILKGFPEIVVLKGSDSIVAETPAVKKQLVHRFHIKPEKVSVVLSGVESDAVTQNTRTTAHGKIVLSVGRISQRKNQLTLLKAIPFVIRSHPDVKFVFAGPIEDADYFQRISNFIEESGISNCVHFTGEVPKRTLDNLYRNATIFVFPTSAEIQGLVLLEAMAFGLPVIASRIEPLVDLVKLDRGSAILVDPDKANGFAQAISMLLDDSALRHSMSLSAKNLASKFSWRLTSEKTLALYNRLLRFNRSARA